MRNKSITELRGIAQSMGVSWGFGDDKDALITKIEAKRDKVVPVAVMAPIPQPEDQRLRSRPPSKVTEEAMICDMLRPLLDRGLLISFSPDGQSWTMRHKDREDTGTMRQPPRNVLRCAERLMA